MSNSSYRGGRTPRSPNQQRDYVADLKLSMQNDEETRKEGDPSCTANLNNPTSTSDPEDGVTSEAAQPDNATDCAATPRTDAEWDKAIPTPKKLVIWSDVAVKMRNKARTLERENVALHAQIHDMCHDKHVSGPVTAEEFCLGCEHFQQSLFGQSPITKLRDENDALRKERDEARQKIVWEFLEDELPSYTQGIEGEHEMTQSVSAETVNSYITKISSLRALERESAILQKERDGIEWCKDCGGMLSACGPQAPDGTPTMDCLVCDLRSQRDSLRTQLAALQKERDEAIVKYTGQANDAEQNHKRALARVESLRTQLTAMTAERNEAIALWREYDPVRARLQSERDAALAQVAKLKEEIVMLTSDLRIPMWIKTKLANLIL